MTPPDINLQKIIDDVKKCCAEEADIIVYRLSKDSRLSYLVKEGILSLDLTSTKYENK
jgi:hypothetical protein